MNYALYVAKCEIYIYKYARVLLGLEGPGLEPVTRSRRARGWPSRLYADASNTGKISSHRGIYLTKARSKKKRDFFWIQDTIFAIVFRSHRG